MFIGNNVKAEFFTKMHILARIITDKKLNALSDDSTLILPKEYVKVERHYLRLETFIPRSIFKVSGDWLVIRDEDFENLNWTLVDFDEFMKGNKLEF